jgi:hypothetical protein
MSSHVRWDSGWCAPEGLEPRAGDLATLSVAFSSSRWAQCRPRRCRFHAPIRSRQGSHRRPAGSLDCLGANVQQWRCNGGKNQLWRIKPMGARYYEIRSELTATTSASMCRDIKGVSLANGANIQQYGCANTMAQHRRVDLAQ